MEVTVITINILIFLLPGFLSLRIDRAIFYNRGNDRFQDLITALIYTFIVILLYTLLIQQLCGSSYPSLTIREGEKWSIIVNEPLGLLIITLFAMILGLSFGYFKNKDFPLRILRNIKVTKRTYYTSFWYEVMNTREEYVVVLLKNGDELVGYIKQFSNDYEQGPAILLTNSFWRKRDGIDVEDYELRTLLLSFDDIKIVEFFKEKRGEQHE